MIKKNLKRLIAILLSLAPLAFAAACSQGDNSASGNDPSDIVEELPGDNPSEETPPVEENSEEKDPEEGTPEEKDPEEETSEEETPSDADPSEEESTKPSLPGGLVDGGNFTGH